ncbi:hypothetical protein [Luteimicrobium sp. DT211]|uniref:hypothetical protein n=1 Tax=Luteimicrobium sp. DT211 TaxID=3393412 RepID=UPI003CF4C77D
MTETPPAPTPGRAVRVARVLLCAAGAACLAVGAWKLTALHAYQLRSLAAWLVAAVVMHDGVLVPLVTVALVAGGVALRRLATRGIAGHRWRAPRGSGVLVAGCLAVGGVLTLLALPELYAQSLGPANPTVVPGDYGRRLALTWLVLGLVAAAGTLALMARGRARRRRRSAGGRARP